VPVLFALASSLLVVAATAGYGALFLAAALGPIVRRLDPVDASAVARATYRVGALGTEQACLAVGPLAVATVATSEGTIGWSAPWVWIGLVLWAASLAVRAAVLQPARRQALVILGELAGSRSGQEARSTQLDRVNRRVQLAASACAALFVIGVAVCASRLGG